MKTMILFLFFFIATTSLSFAQEDNQGKELFESKCNKCHGLDRALGKKKDLQGWRSTTRRMSEKRNSGITRDEAETIARYLTSINKK